MRNSPYDNFLEDQIRECMQSCESVWSDAIKYKVNDASNAMKQLYRDLFDLRQDFSVYREVKSMNDESTEYESIMQQVHNLKAQRQHVTRIQKEEELKNVLARVRGDEDIVIEESSAPTVMLCPITNKIPIHPVVSRKCQHIYEKDAILSYIQDRTGGRQNLSVPCPVAGCNKQLWLIDIVEDPEVTKKVNEARRLQTQGDEYEVL